MSKRPYLLALDQGTTSTRAMLFDADGAPVISAQEALPQIFPQPGWVEHDPEAIWAGAQAVLRQVLKKAAAQGIKHGAIAALGITNQRETTVLWERKSLKPVHNAIVWQDRRTAAYCDGLKARGLEALVRERTGLVIDPYFSASKIAWLLEHMPSLRAKAEAGALAFGTVDSFLIARLTKGRVHATDVTNASRTLLFDIVRKDWNDDLLKAFGVPRAMLPEIRQSADDYGRASEEAFGLALPIGGVAGDQQAALVGQGCLAEGSAKITFGTGAFLLHNTGAKPVASKSGLLTAPAYAAQGQTVYALEGSVFIAGAVVQWLRDGLKLFEEARESEDLAAAADARRPVYFVPAFTGLGAPYWDAEARGAILGLTRDVGAAEIVRAGLEGVSFQVRDLMEAIAGDVGASAATQPLNADGGMVANAWFMQNLADILGRPVARAAMAETTARGAALLAGLTAGVYPSLEILAWSARADRVFEPRMSADERAARYAGWRAAVARVRAARA
jgi:glycerol kinase